MAKITEIADVVPGQKITAALWNAFKNAIQNEFGHSGQTTGNIDNDNIKPAAAIDPGKIANTALVQSGAGTQSVTKATIFSNAKYNYTPGTDVSSVTAINDGVTTIALADTTKRFQRYYYPNTAASNASITTITGGAVGQVITITIDNQDAAQTVSLVSDTGTATVNGLKLKNQATYTAAASQRVAMGTFVYGDLDNSGVNMWWEI